MAQFGKCVGSVFIFGCIKVEHDKICASFGKDSCHGVAHAVGCARDDCHAVG